MSNAEHTNSLQNSELGQSELLKIRLEQLHKVVLNLSKNCFEIKKLCVTILISASILLISFTSQELDLSIFICGLIAVLFFCILDVQSCYYQSKIRVQMRRITESLAQLCSSRQIETIRY